MDYPKSIFELLKHVEFRKRPAMWLGAAEISKLRVFIEGYCHACSDHNMQMEMIPPFGWFHEWARHKFHWSESTAGWDRIILQENNGDEFQALENFFEVYDEFCEVTPITMRKAFIEQKELDFYTCISKVRRFTYVDGEEKRLSSPEMIYIITLSHNFGEYAYQLRGRGMVYYQRYEVHGRAEQALEEEFGAEMNFIEIPREQLVKEFQTVVGLF